MILEVGKFKGKHLTEKQIRAYWKRVPLRASLTLSLSLTLSHSLSHSLSLTHSLSLSLSLTLSPPAEALFLFLSCSQPRMN